MSGVEGHEDRLAELERQVASRGSRPANDRQDVDRELPIDVFGRMSRGQITPQQAREAARERWSIEEARGATASDLVREQLARQQVTGEIDWFSKTKRDEHGRFKPKDEPEPGARGRPMPTR